MLMYWKNRAVNGVWKLQRRVYEVLRNEDGVGTVEVVLLILVATGLVLIFKDRITELVTNIFGKSRPRQGRYEAESRKVRRRASCCILCR